MRFIPTTPKGGLALKFNALARRETCAAAAEAAGLADHIILANSEAGSGGRRKVAILSGACEAVIAALYLDGGMAAARRFVERYWVDAFAALNSDMRDPKTILQEWAQSRAGNNDAPLYKIVGRTGPDHAPRFEVQVSVGGSDVQTRRGRFQARSRTGRGEENAGEIGNEDMSQHCGFAAVIGAPNAGKSTLVNALVGSKVAIVSPKVQTTRMPVRGVAIRGDTQIVLVDTPGIFTPRRRLDRAMVKAAWAGAGDADAVVLLVDAAEVTASPLGHAAKDTDAIIEGLKTANRKAALALNKIDAMKHAELLPLVEKLNAQGVFEQVFMISALERRRARGARRLVRVQDAAKALGFIPPIRPPTFPRACWRRKSPARKSICACMTNCLMPLRSKPRNGKSAKTAR